MGCPGRIAWVLQASFQDNGKIREITGIRAKHHKLSLQATRIPVVIRGEDNKRFYMYMMGRSAVEDKGFKWKKSGDDTPGLLPIVWSASTT
jgi:hypothetical protein